MVGSVFQDLKYAWRSLNRQRVVSRTITLTLALGIGANSTLFSVADKVLLREPPFSDPERLVVIFNR